MRTKHAMTFICLVLVAGFTADSFGGGFAALGRYLRKGSYESHRRENCGYTNCQQPWQPIKSRMHCNVLPEGMRHVPLARPWPGISPQTPLKWRAPAAPTVVRPVEGKQDILAPVKRTSRYNTTPSQVQP